MTSGEFLPFLNNYFPTILFAAPTGSVKSFEGRLKREETPAEYMYLLTSFNFWDDLLMLLVAAAAANVANVADGPWQQAVAAAVSWQKALEWKLLLANTQLKRTN